MTMRFSSDSSYEPYYGYSRAVRAGDRVYVSGTCAQGADADSADPYVQAVSALAVVSAALVEAGSSMSDVVRTVTYVTSVDHVDAVARAHREAFSEILPAATCVVVAALVAPNLLVEIQVDAVVGA
jgi:enamine deaminase RidA (YjgF/YER057c/UK114 family)